MVSDEELQKAVAEEMEGRHKELMEKLTEKKQEFANIKKELEGKVNSYNGILGALNTQIIEIQGAIKWLRHESMETQQPAESEEKEPVKEEESATE